MIFFEIFDILWNFWYSLKFWIFFWNIGLSSSNSLVLKIIPCFVQCNQLRENKVFLTIKWYYENFNQLEMHTQHTFKLVCCFLYKVYRNGVTLVAQNKFDLFEYKVFLIFIALEKRHSHFVNYWIKENWTVKVTRLYD